MRLFAACYGAADTLAHRDHEEQQDARHHEIAEIARHPRHHALVRGIRDPHGIDHDPHTAFTDVRAYDLKKPTPIGLVSSCTRNANGND